jgi:hypothetical protein
MTRNAPNRRMIDAAHVITTHTAGRFTLALELLGRVHQCADGCAAEEKVNTSGISSPVEREVMIRYEARTRTEDMRDHLQDWLHTSDLFAKEIEGIIGWAYKMLGMEPEGVAVKRLCDGEGYEGRELAWVPMSRDPHNGWHDATCRDLTTTIGQGRDAMHVKVCARCLVRMNRWRERNGLPMIGVQAASVAA